MPRGSRTCRHRPYPPGLVLGPHRWPSTGAREPTLLRRPECGPLRRDHQPDQNRPHRAASLPPIRDTAKDALRAQGDIPLAHL